MRAFFTLVAIASSVAASQTITGAFDCLTSGQFTLCQNLWGASVYFPGECLVFFLINVPLLQAPESAAKTLRS